MNYRNNPQLNKHGELIHLLSIEGLPRALIHQILDTAGTFLSVNDREVKKVPLMRGKSATEVRLELSARGIAPEVIEAALPHRTFPGNRPSTFLLLDRIDPHRLGSLIALYEHKVFVEGVLWGINSFDQWGVELGKQLAGHILTELSGAPAAQTHDASTAALIARVRDGLRSQ